MGMQGQVRDVLGCVGSLLRFDVVQGISFEGPSTSCVGRELWAPALE